MTRVINEGGSVLQTSGSPTDSEHTGKEDSEWNTNTVSGVVLM